MIDYFLLNRNFTFITSVSIFLGLALNGVDFSYSDLVVMYVLYDKCFFFAVNIFITFPIKIVSALQFISSVFSAVARATVMVGTQLN